MTHHPSSHPKIAAFNLIVPDEILGPPRMCDRAALQHVGAFDRLKNLHCILFGYKYRNSIGINSFHDLEISSMIRGARPSEGSSRIKRRGCAISARPMASICCSPPDRTPANCFTRSFRRGK